MKKLFLLISVLVLSLAINAGNVINITPTSPHSANNLIAALQGASDGDVIILADGTYSENNNYIVFDKNVTVKAAENAHPIVEVECFIKVQSNKSVSIRGIKFDGSKQDATGVNSTAYTHFIRVYTAGTLDLDNCEFYNIGNQVIEVAESESHIDHIKIDSCYFHDCTNSALYVKKGSSAHLCDRVDITNSTFAKFSGFDGGVIAVSSKNEALDADPANDYLMTVDHCTFYNCIKTDNSTYGVIDSRKSARITVSNCIFANPASLPDGTYASKATQMYGGTVLKCLRHNVPAHRNTPSSGNDINEDPLFNDLANNKYTYAGTYGVSMSPARGAGTDGSDLGDPRWYTPVTYPSTNFASPGYYCSADAATISANVYGLSLYTDSEPHYIKCNEATYNALLAKWSITATRACYISVALDLGPEVGSNKHIFEVKILDANSNPVGTLAEDPADPDGDTENNKEANQVKTFDGYIIIPEAGNYTIELRSIRGHGKGSIKNIILTYAGGETVDIPNDEIPFEDAILGNGATRDLDEIHFGSVSAYAQWNIHADADGIYSFTFDVVGTDYGKYNLLIKDSENSTIYDSFKGFNNSGSVTHSNILLDAGDYTIQVANVNTGSVGSLTNIAVSATEGVFILNDNKTDDGSIAAADYGTTSTRFDVYLKRSFTAGKYYTICVPFDSYDSQLSGAFGSGYEVWKMASAEQDGDVINLNFEQINGDNFAAGTPYIIKTTIDVENPVFSNKKVCNYTYNNTKSFTAADFVGTFYKDEIPAGENNLYLQNNNLYYSESSNTTIKGTRAWIRLKQQQGSAPARARIVMGGQVATDINLVNGELVNGTVKVIENGQIILIRDGKKYNVMGARLQ